MDTPISISRVDRIPVDIGVTATNPDGSAGTVGSLDVTVLAPRATPATGAVWRSVTFANGKASVVIAGPDADGTGAFVIPAAGADLWVRDTGSNSTQAVKAGRVVVK